MTPPDEVRAAFEKAYMPDLPADEHDEVFALNDDGTYCYGDVQTPWLLYQSAYASGSAAKKDAIVVVLKGLPQYETVRGRVCLDRAEAIERIEKE